jgi:ABC-2 type transport system ATP-binding protein
MWDEVRMLAAEAGLTILLTTHYLEEADVLAQRVAIVSRGQIVVEGPPEELKRALQGDAVHVELADGRVAEASDLIERAGARPETVLDGRTVVARAEDGGRALPGVLAALDQAGIPVASVSVSRPSLDDVYLHYTGRDFGEEDRAA